jgi:hypothetical protein
MTLQPFYWTLAAFLIVYTVDRTPWTGDQSVERPLHTHIHRTHTYIHASSEIRIQKLKLRGP